MKTVNQKAMEVAEKIDQCSCLAAIHGLIIMTLKEQDQDTRHACAEAVEACSVDGLINLQKACAACINVQAL